MASQAQIIERPGPLGVPWSYVLGATEVLRPVSAFVRWDGTGASGAFLPCLSFYSQDGKVFMRVFPSSSIAQGGVADVSYAPFPGGLIQTAPSGSSTGTLFLTAAGMWPSLTNGASFPNRIESVTNLQDAYMIDFASGSQSFAQAQLAMPADWNAGTITAAFVWLVNGTATGNVTWGLQGRAYGSGATLDQAWGTQQTVSTAATGTANQVIVSAATSAVTLAGTPAAGQFVMLRANRAAVDTLAATARLLGITVTYTRS